MTRFWDTIAVGEAREIGAHRFTAADIKRFAALYDPQSFHLDEAAAKHSVLKGLCASGWHTAAVYMRLNVDHGTRLAAEWAARGNPPPRMGPSPGVRNLCWPRPVFAGDTVLYRQTVTDKRPSTTRPGWGVVSFEANGANEQGETVFSFEGSAFVGTE